MRSHFPFSCKLALCGAAVRFWTQRKDLMLDVLSSVSASPLRDRLVLQGGAALHFVYGSPRLTRDLDFVAPPDAFPRFKDVAAAVPGIKLRREDLRSAPPFMRGAVQTRHGGVWLSVPVEIAGVRVEGVAEAEAAPGVRVAVETPDEIMTDKVVACFARMQGRGAVKPQDVFDIAYLRRALGARTTPEAVRHRLADYGMQFVPETGRRILDWLASVEAVWAVRDALGASGTADHPEGGATALASLPAELRPEAVVAVCAEVFHELGEAF